MSTVKKRRLAALERISARRFDPAGQGTGEPQATPPPAGSSTGSNHGQKQGGQSSGGAAGSPSRSAAGSSRQHSNREHAPATDAQVAQSHEIYDPAPSDMLRDKLISRTKLGIHNLLEDLITSSSRCADASDSIRAKVQDHVLLLDNPAKQVWVHGKQTPRPVMHRAKKRSKKIPIRGGPVTCRATASSLHDLATHLHRQWAEYIGGVCNPATPKTLEDATAAGRHGCLLTVIKSKSVQVVGFRGIVIHETKCMIYLLSTGKTVRAAPKCGSVFECQLPTGESFHLHGDNLRGL